MNDKMKRILETIERLNVMHARKLKRSLAGRDSVFDRAFSEFMNKYETFLRKSGKDLEFGIQSYLRFCDDLLVEQLEFKRSGKYTCPSFAEAEARVYSSPEVMEYYMHGLLLSQFLWNHHYLSFKFFTDHLKRFPSPGKYLEIGAGHGLFTSSAIDHFPKETSFTVVDVSPKSIEICRDFLPSSVIFVTANIFDFHPPEKFDFLVMGEVLEHVENPGALLKHLRTMTRKGGTLFLTVPCNAPAIDHVTLFRDSGEVRDLLTSAGLKIVLEDEFPSEDVPREDWRSKKIATRFVAFCEAV